eukprot:TRINITY_DN1277_c0_g1_i1.p1 TRINITY_DN1277_c0_g1~~TRINITY_DN1277_c0_g1_i1.p1  ORF type:complete len:480 (+),score=96.13 TRINITY_DN1277_c0_g1_i1:94-1533(+)
MNVCEFFSGIGGLRSSIPKEIKINKVISYDTSPVTNKVYIHNFGKEDIRQKLIETVMPDEMDKEEFDIILMSPPCQPYTKTRASLQKDEKDKRSKGFLYTMKMLMNMSHLPKYIFLENVKGFINSNCLLLFKEALVKLKYSFKCFLLSPIQFGIPNNRTRFYMICERSNRFFEVKDFDFSNNNYLTLIDSPSSSSSSNNNENNNNNSKPLLEYNKCYTYLENNDIFNSDVQPLNNFIDDEISDEELQQFLIPEKILKKNWAKGLSVVGKYDKTTFCFTRGYSKVYHVSSGSLFFNNAPHSFQENPLDKSDMTKYVNTIRFFTPKELLRLFHFPKDFSFPDNTSLRDKYKVIGNSVNVLVINQVLKYLLSTFDPIKKNYNSKNDLELPKDLIIIKKNQKKILRNQNTTSIPPFMYYYRVLNGLSTYNFKIIRPKQPQKKKQKPKSPDQNSINDSSLSKSSNYSSPGNTLILYYKVISNIS